MEPKQGRIVVPGEFYRHFKDKLYQVKSIAYHSETKEKMVVYQAMYGSFQVYVRPYEMFLSEVDHQKYPEAAQKYRFEKVILTEDEALMKAEKSVKNEESVKGEKPVKAEESVKGEEPVKNKEAIKQQAEKEAEEAETEPEEIELQEIGEEADNRLVRFLEAATYEDKLNILTGLRDKLDDDLITAMGVSIDAQIQEGPIEKRYTSLKNCILAHIKYESGRIR